MPPTDFNIGKNATLVLIADGAIVGTASLTEFSFKQEVIKLKSRPLNGRPIHKTIPDGWSGSFAFDRVDSTLDDYFADAEDAFWNNNGQVPKIYIQQTVNELDGSVSQFRYEGVQMEFANGGAYKQEDKVGQSVTWEASARRRVA